MKNVAIIILAAGESSRMGTSKQLLKIEGKNLLERVVELVGKLEPRKTVVVLGANAEAHQRVLKPYSKISSVVNEEWETGIGSSIKTGLASVMQSDPRIDGALFLVCDQPLLSKSHLEKMIHEYDTSDSSIIASGYDQTEGVPALFDKKHFAELLTLKGGEGAKRIIETHGEAKTVIPFPEGKIDLDTPDDLRTFLDDPDKKTVSSK